MIKVYLVVLILDHGHIDPNYKDIYPTSYLNLF